MANVMELVRNGGRMVNSVEEVLDVANGLYRENTALKTLVEKQGALLVAIDEKLETVMERIDGVQDVINAGNKVTNEIKHKKFYGQQAELLPTAIDKAKEMSGSAVRALIHSAAKSHESGKRKGYTHIYEKLLDVTGFNVYEVGKVRLKKSDNVDGWGKDPSYINAILQYGKATETAVICMQIKAGK